MPGSGILSDPAVIGFVSDPDSDGFLYFVVPRSSRIRVFCQIRIWKKVGSGSEF